MTCAVKAVLCDLDDTLFDHRHATRTALMELAEEQPALRAWPSTELFRRHAAILEALHVDVLDGRRTADEARLERFARLLAEAGSDRVPERAEAAAGFYRSAYERAWRAVPGARELLAALAGSGVRCVVVTNNSVAEQRRKLAGVGLEPHVVALVTSEEVGASKPSRRIFEAALAAAGAAPHEAVMFGDGWHNDVVGARDAGIAPIWFNPLAAESPDRTVPELHSLVPTETVVEQLLYLARASA
jgi:putative hydrolase of the HAD superfamily